MSTSTTPPAPPATATDGRTRLRDGWRDMIARFSAEEIARCELKTFLRRDSGSYRLSAIPAYDGNGWQWEIACGNSPVPVKSGRAATGGEAQRRADSAFATIERRARRGRWGR